MTYAVVVYTLRGETKLYVVGISAAGLVILLVLNFILFLKNVDAECSVYRRSDDVGEGSLYQFYYYYFYDYYRCLQCFNTVGWVSGRACGL